YRYRTLPNQDDFRVLELQPGPHDANLSIHLRTVSLSDYPPYEALSYVWGHLSKSYLVICGGKSIPITQSLHEFLLEARDEAEVKTIWADALCINQDDLAERSHQVRIMYKIYENSARTTIWLG
ncbi:heterokaryon incompatibility protein-domain-containing protein, partial [Lophiotrema nucula]